MRKEYCPRYEALNNVVVIWNKSLDKPFKEIGKMGYSFCRINHDGSIMVWIHSDRTNRIINWFINIPLGPITEPSSRWRIFSHFILSSALLPPFSPSSVDTAVAPAIIFSFSEVLRERLLFHFNTFTHAWFVR